MVKLEMRGIGRGKRGRGGTSCGRKIFQGRGNFGATSQPHIQTGRVSDASVEMGQPSNPNQGTLQIGRVSTNSLQIPSLETQSSQNVAEPVHCSPEAENCAISSSNKKIGRGRGKYKSKSLEVVSERNKRNRENQIIKHTCGTKSFAEVEESTRNPITGELDTPDKVWEIQHTRKDDRGELVWLDSQSQQIHGQLQEVVAQQQSEDIKHPMTRDEILSSVVGERTGYVRGKGYRKNPPKKSNIQHANIEARVSSAIDIVRQEMQAEMDRKLQEEREQMAAELRRNMEIELEKKLEEECQHANEERQHANAETDKRISLEVEKKMHEQFASFLTRMQHQQGQGT
uniref:Uncharacterized protein isoform X2 n=2 Tax=Nicotiana tabacum TaxID=4097 RepID=A0A1S4A2X9_TOBAC|nr:PREDICTED: uncharacterized protein LOC107793189 isoform X2 [Nicotiana tabacum]